MKTSIKLTKKEEDVVIKMVAERMKNVVYMSAERTARQVIKTMKRHNVDVHDELTCRYNITFLVNDVIEIVGGLRRNTEKV